MILTRKWMSPMDDSTVSRSSVLSSANLPGPNLAWRRPMSQEPGDPSWSDWQSWSLRRHWPWTSLGEKNAHDDQSSHPVVQTPATSWASWNPGSQGPWINLEWNIEPQNSQQSQGWKLMFQTHSWGFNQVPVQVFEGIYFYIICSSSPHQLHRDSWIPCPVLRTEIKISSFRDRLPFCPEVRWSHAA